MNYSPYSIGRQIFNYIMLFNVLIIILHLAACTLTNQTKPHRSWPLPDSQCVFLQFQVKKHGNLIEGWYPPGEGIDSPTYHYNKTTQTLRSKYINFPVNESLKLIYGSSLYLSGVVGKGVASALTGVYDIPFKKDGITIEKVDKSGKIILHFRKELIILKPGEEWSRKTTQMDSIHFSGQRGIAEITITETIKNSGTLNKGSIIPD